MSTFNATRFGASMILAAGIPLAAMALLPPAASAAPLGQTPEPSPCAAQGDMIAAPTVLLLGETATVSLTFAAQCPVEPPIPLHIVLVLDGTASMAGDPSERLREDAQALVRQLDLPSYPSERMGVVVFGETVATLCPLMRDVDVLLACIGRVGASGTMGIDAGIQEGLRVLLQGRKEAADRPYINEVMVLMSNGLNGAGCPPVIQAARQAKAQGIIVVTKCVTDACDAPCMRDAASSARYAYPPGDVDAMLALFERIRRDIVEPRRLSLTIVDTLPANMAYEQGSAVPPAEFDAAGNRLTWKATFYPELGITTSFRLRPRQTGSHPVSLGATASAINSVDPPITYTFPVAQISVLEPEVQPPPTAVVQRWKVYLPVAGLLPRSSTALRAGRQGLAPGRAEDRVLSQEARCPERGREGTVAWAFAAEGTMSGPPGIAGPPAVDDSGASYFGTTEGKIYSVACSGGERWVVDATARVTDLGPEWSFASPPALDDDDTLYIGMSQTVDYNALFALGTDGRWHWSLLWAAGESEPSLSAVGPVVLGTEGRVYFRDGKPLSRRFVGQLAGLTVAHRDGVVLRGFPLEIRSSLVDPVLVAEDRLVFVSDASGTRGPPTRRAEAVAAATTTPGRSGQAPSSPQQPTRTPSPTVTARVTATPTPFIFPPRGTSTPTWTPRPAAARAMLPIALHDWHYLKPTELEDNDAMLHILQGARIPSRRLPLGHIRVASLVATERIAILETLEDSRRLFALALDDARGVPLWEHRLARPIVGGPVLGGRDPATGRRELVYADAGGRLVSLAVAEDAGPTPDPVLNWALTLPDTATAAPALGDDGLVYVGAGSTIVAVRRRDGDVAWESEIDAELGTVTGAVTLGPTGLLHVATSNGFLLAIHTGAGGLDPSAAWPALRHDRRNSGRAANDRASLSAGRPAAPARRHPPTPASPAGHPR